MKLISKILFELRARKRFEQIQQQILDYLEN